MNFKRVTDYFQVLAFIEADDYTCLDLETECAVEGCVNPKCRHALEPETNQLSDIVLGRGDDVIVFTPEFVHLLRELKGTLVCHNFRFDLKMLIRKHQVDLRHMKVYDTMLMDHLVDENQEHGLDAIVQRYWKDNYKEVFWGKYARYEDAPESEQMEYACKDVWYTHKLHGKLADKLRLQGVPVSLVEHVHRLALALFDTEVRGLPIDLDYTVTMGSQLKADIERTEIELRQAGGFHCEALELEYWAKEIEKAYTPNGKKWKTLPKPQFNFSSSGQVMDLLYGKLGLAPVISKKTKKPTVDDAALASLEEQHPIISKIRDFREYSKMYGAFVDGIMTRAVDGRVYPSFSVNGTVTGRISHSAPNMGQMPAQGEWAKVRGIFVASPGHKILTCDYGQLEICLAAHFSKDPTLLGLINSGESMHDKTAAELKEYGVTRKQAKAINFGIIYGAMEHKISEVVGCDQKKAKEILEKFWTVYTGLKEAIFECHKKVEAGEPSVNPFGRRRRFPTKFEDRWEEQRAKRQAFNSLVQGTGADLTSRAFYLMAERLRENGHGRGLFTVHDELVIEVREDCVAEERGALASTMVGCGAEIPLLVPLTVDGSDGLERWAK